MQPIHSKSDPARSNPLRRFRRGTWSGVIELLEPRRLLTAFSTAIDNPFFPLVPGTTYVYEGTDEEGAQLLHRVNVTSQTKDIGGVATRVVRSLEYADGELTEETEEWFAQDVFGNVWYFGEDSNEIEDEIVSRAGSWMAGVNGARAGIIMPAAPAVGQRYAMESHPGVAEDQAQVLATGARLSVPFGAFANAIQIAETNPLEPEVLEYKWYARGVGFVMAEDVAGEGEVVRLAAVELTPSATAAAIADENLLLVPNAAALRRPLSPGATESIAPANFGAARQVFADTADLLAEEVAAQDRLLP